MTLPRQPPKEGHQSDAVWKGGCLGAFGGGVVLPICFAVYAHFVLKDAGGLLFWPIMAILGAIVGLTLGILLAVMSDFLFRRWR